MTNSAFTKLLQQTARAKNKYLKLLVLAEKEYERRYGTNPSDVDDDLWIDSLHSGSGFAGENLTAEEVDENAVSYANLESYINKPESRKTKE